MKVPYISISGADWERIVFNCTARDFPVPERATWEDAIEEVAANQQRFNWNSISPPTPTARKIFLDVQRRLDRQFREYLELYCAIGTSLDWDYGTDGFFRIDKYVVPIDLTSNRKKAFLKSDVVIVMAQDVLGKKLGRPCRRIARIFNKSLREIDFGGG
ncbi:MAG: hypothetical protein Q7S86_04220 [bacterium]|nr:hypothetical protein [bacterium]